VNHSLSNAAINDILKDIGSNLTIYKLKKKVQNIVQIEPILYDTCKNSCVAFTQQYETLLQCPLCNENRYNMQNNPVNSTFFFSLKSRLKIQYANKEKAEEFQYRSTYFTQSEKLDIYGDIFDGKYVKNFYSFVIILYYIIY